ncbi:hypothetical protein LTR35_000148 [Friedmanniomyces endolithicus]|uniref:Uncharacterized protein n=1 Tax=Friedmanniomyces endolithicus TaxID=329885 RepID=A0AAN6FML9_9PEZI|nr:hypothetical protein LTS00_008791 [Friedmanniomyces endolithicus]KAK0293544.1 hypothetical protein LTR35_000148 [Friedmanniomyces endolithicus]KAK0318880.1 hypothetical protein LTR82_009980 [Friedmanniomyces endolithicus]KAK0997314.1 hypothetical protein LTR54_009774 [Friedmanniomyces endolithicus]
MPHGILTPLGRQLRTVLANLRSAESRVSSSSAPGLHLQHGRLDRTSARSSSSDSAAAAATASDVAEVVRFDDVTVADPDLSPLDSVRRSYLTEALHDAGKDHAIARARSGKRDLSHVDVGRAEGWEQFEVNAARHQHDTSVALAHTTALTLERLVASCIQHMSTWQDTGQGEWDSSFQLTSSEDAFLRKQGYGKPDLEVWARIVSMRDPLDAANSLAELVRASNGKHVPVFLLTFLLRRDEFKSRALCVLLEICPRLLDGHLRRTGLTAPSENTIFVIFVRLVRHAREVWPSGMQPITELLLAYLPKASMAHIAPLNNLTNMLNKAMHLLSLETAAAPFQDNPHQEAAIVRILRFMTEHQPQLQITRDGYRAVVRIQLAQKKTPGEQQWADLKALSWPPWKQNRTAMDADITALEHGTTAAAATLRRMREAGYRPTEWERTAELHAGWDVDGTPAIQRRALLGTGSTRFRFQSAVWAARIASTRTAQEAWAAYLASEDALVPASDDVHSAIVQKLYGEEQRQRMSADREKSEDEPTEQRERLRPGDAKEVDPLPPSTHLYTYTRLPVPTVEGFVRHLQDRQFQLGHGALAFVVAHAARLRLGFRYLQASSSHIPGIDTLLSFDLDASTAAVSDPLFTAFIKLLCRFSNVPLNTLGGKARSASFLSHKPLSRDGNMFHALNPHHPIVFALELLRARGTTSHQAWNAILQALSRNATLESMRFLRVADTFSSAERDLLDWSRGAIKVYGLVTRTLSLLQDVHTDLDSPGFHCLCLTVENLAIGCWTVLRSDNDEANAPRRIRSFGLIEPTATQDANALLRSSSHVKQLKGIFDTLIGVGPNTAKSPYSPSTEDDSSPRPPPPATALPPPNPLPLLHIPSTAVLHAYVRALGWMADHAGLLSLIRWIVAHRDEVNTQWSRERTSREMLRKALTALRVFLERSWLRETEVRKQTDQGEHCSASAGVGSEADDASAASPPPDPKVQNLRMLEGAASAEVRDEIEALVNGVDSWRGWPTDEEVARYCRHRRFEQIRELVPR